MFPIFHRILFYFLKKETERQIIIYTTIYAEENDNNSDGTRSYFQYFVELYFYLFIYNRELVWEKFQLDKSMEFEVNIFSKQRSSNARENDWLRATSRIPTHLPPLQRNSIRRRGTTSGGKSLWQHTFAVFPGCRGADIDFQFVGERENYRRCRCRRD